jgi:hypothetical protein
MPLDQNLPRLVTNRRAVLLRLFAVFWWLLVVGSVGTTLWKAQLEHEDNQKFERDMADWERYNTGRNPDGSMAPIDLGTLPTRPLDEHPFDNPTYAGASGVLRYLGVYFAILLVPFAVMTVIRWIATSRWRFGPRW